MQRACKKYTVFLPTCFGGQPPSSVSNTWNIYDLKPNKASSLGFKSCMFYVFLPEDATPVPNHVGVLYLLLLMSINCKSLLTY
jgi:hypothetical protein